MLVVVLLSVFGLACGQTINLPHGHQLKDLVDIAFNRIDHSPRDGMVSESEYDALVATEDTDGDNCVTEAEWLAARPNAPTGVPTAMYHHYVGTSGTCLTIDMMKAEYHKIDKDADNQVDIKEFEHYYTHLLGQIFGHAHNG